MRYDYERKSLQWIFMYSGQTVSIQQFNLFMFSLETMNWVPWVMNMKEPWEKCRLFEPRHDKTNTVTVRPAKTQISLGIRPVRSESSLSAWRNLGSLATRWAHSEDSDQTGWMPGLIWVFAGSTLILLVLSCRGSFMFSCFISSVYLFLGFVNN